MPGAPVWLQPLAATTRTEGGDRQGARRLLTELATTADEDWVRRSAIRGLNQIQALDDIDLLQQAVDAYRERRHSDPTGWPDLVRAGLLPGHPIDPTGAPYSIDAESHRVVLSPESSLNPLPSLPRSR